MTYSDIKLKAPISKPIKGDEKDVPLIVSGQGTLLFENIINTEPCILYIYTKNKSDGFKIVLTDKDVIVSRINTTIQYVDAKNNSGLVNNCGAYYWFSLDSQNQTLRLGVGEARTETIIYNYTFLFQTDDDRKKHKLFLESLNIFLVADESNSLHPLRLLRDPVTNTLANEVKNTDEICMTDIALGAYLPKANLSLVAQQLYECISGKNFVLDTPDFPDFVQAIEYSIKTPGCYCYERLRQKSTEFNKTKPNLNETYLRITLGQNNGESPGIPYVMEIWPVGHYSPVHNHSSADAIIRVLNGTINVSQFPYLGANVKPFAINDFHKDQITWISPTLNQTHQLLNRPENTATCITIQCYMYEQQN